MPLLECGHKNEDLPVDETGMYTALCRPRVGLLTSGYPLAWSNMTEYSLAFPGYSCDNFMSISEIMLSKKHFFANNINISSWVDTFFTK